MTEHLPIARPGRTRRSPARDRRGRTPRHRYFAFLSYSHKDEDLAEWLHSELEQFRVPSRLVGKITEQGVIPRRLTPVFRDRQELGAATDLGEEIEQALTGSQFLIVLCSPSAARSRWTNAEIAAFKRSRPDGCVLAAIASGEPFASEIPGRESDECFPPALRQRYDRLGRPTGKRAEPLAADLRDAHGGRRVGFLRIVAGMLGVGLDELVQRETTRRHRRLAYLAAASLAGMALTSVLAVTAIRARDEARDQRREAEGLVAFMLGDLKDKLEPIGKLDALDGVGTRVLSYYRGQDAAELSDEALMQRSRALSLTAQVAYLRGDFNTAQKLYAEAREGTAEAIKRDPDDPQRLFEHAQNAFYLAQMAANDGDLAGAEQGFREYRSLAKRMTTLQPDNLQWRMEAQYADVNLGVVLLRLRHFEEAAARFASGLRTIEAVAALDRHKVDYQLSTAETLAWLADAELARGNLAAAIDARQRQVAILRALANGTANVQPRAKLIPAQMTLGRLLGARGQAQAAELLLTDTVTAARQLLPSEPNNSVWLNNAADAHFALADFYGNQGNLNAAAVNVSRGCDLASTLSKFERTAVKSRISRWSCHYRKAWLELAQKRPAQALKEAQRAVADARNIRSGEANSDKSLMIRSLLLEGDAWEQSGATNQARAAWQRGLGLSAAARELPWESASRAELLERLGRHTEARALNALLQRNGFSNMNVLRS